MGPQEKKRRLIKTLYLDPVILEKRNLAIAAKLRVAVKDEVRFESYMTEDADILIVAYGTVARISKTAIRILREKGFKVGLLRPISLYPFPYEAFTQAAERIRDFLVIEMSMGQMLEDVKLAICGKSRLHFYSRVGGMVPSYDEIIAETQKIVRKAI